MFDAIVGWLNIKFSGFTGISVSLDLAVFVTIILTLTTWKITKNKERNDLQEKDKDKARKALLEYVGKLKDITKRLIDFKNVYDNVSNKLSEEEKKELQSKNRYLIDDYKKNLDEFLFISPAYSKNFYKILKNSSDDFEFAKKNGSIEIIVFNSVITIYKLLVEYTEEEIANDLLKTIYGLTREDAEKKLEEFKNYLNKNK
ncbi:hypothetical protein ACN9KI_04010 [Aliarcobacter butzleri]|uniref:hypothetical protein n=1 Tax=Aliarcobacter butzleri TaxID=28197 RepID=UPI003B20ED33